MVLGVSFGVFFLPDLVFECHKVHSLCMHSNRGTNANVRM